MSVGGSQEGADHGLAGDAWVGAAGEKVAGVVIEPVDDLHTVPSVSCQWVKSDCQHSLGWSAWNRR